MIQAQLEMPEGPQLNPQPSVHSVQSSFGGPIDSMDIIYDKYIEILDSHCNDMAEYVTVTTTNFISSVYEVLPPLEQRMNLLLRPVFKSTYPSTPGSRDGLRPPPSRDPWSTHEVGQQIPF